MASMFTRKAEDQRFHRSHCQCDGEAAREALQVTRRLLRLLYPGCFGPGGSPGACGTAVNLDQRLEELEQEDAKKEEDLEDDREPLRADEAEWEEE